MILSVQQSLRSLPSLLQYGSFSYNKTHGSCLSVYVLRLDTRVFTIYYSDVYRALRRPRDRVFSVQYITVFLHTENGILLKKNFGITDTAKRISYHVEVHQADRRRLLVVVSGCVLSCLVVTSDPFFEVIYFHSLLRVS